ncbi:hypothetical protein CC78DRAFT_18201 [Lojkania enalia]|uniref:Uncharacterized protein n=1 Tax=Lojkania enalia TaxID=147567 RepID=A0A9P4KJ98_9PLEO|nr:hypothetical protein CC78DRAFT_18201 [Didymosphaeria enalia]
MNKSFLRFNESAIQSGLLQLNPSLAYELKSVTEKFVTLAKTAATEVSPDGDDETTDVGLDPATELHKATALSISPIEANQARTEGLPTSDHMDVGWGYSATFEESSRASKTTSFQNRILGRNSFFQPATNSAFESAKESNLTTARLRPITVGQVLDQSRSRTDASDNDLHLPFGLVDLMDDHQSYSPDRQIFSVGIPTPDVTPPNTRLSTPPLLPELSTKSLAPIWTYSHDETSFARRLTRASLETGFHLLSSANLRRAALNHVFKLSLPYMSLDALRERFKQLLSRGTDEDLDCLTTPFIHLGGAGTHYPRKDVQGNVIPIPNAWAIRSIGPPILKLMRAENVEDPSKSHDLNIDLTGFEGEWFDPYDVQGYLEQEKGCYINPRDSFAEVMIEVDDDKATSTGMDDVVYGKNINLNLDFSHDRTTTQSISPGLSNAPSTTNSLSSESSPPTSTGSDPLLGNSDAPFGLDLSVASITSFGKFSDADLFDQPLGLDLAPGFITGFNSSAADFNANAFGDMSSLGLDLTETDMEPIPIVKQKRKQAALIDVSKLVDGKCRSIAETSKSSST